MRPIILKNQWIFGLSIQERCAQPRHRALLKRRSLFVAFTSFVESSFPKAQKRAPTTASNFRKYAPRIDDKSHQKEHKWAKIVVWGGLGAVLGGLGAQRTQRPARMHFRMRKPRSWLTLWEWFLVQFALFFELFFVVFSTMHPERHLIDIWPISNTFSQTFGEVFGDAGNNDFLQPF